MNNSELAEALRLGIADALREAGHDGLADLATRAGGWIADAAPWVRASVLAGEDILAGDAVGFGDDDLVYRCTSEGPAFWGTADEDAAKHNHVYVVTPPVELGPGTFRIGDQEIRATSITYTAGRRGRP